MGSLAGVATLLSGDREFMQSRNSNKRKKARNVLQGVELGAKSLYEGISQGLVGVVMQPIKGTKKEGAVGFFKGVAKGLSGLVMKPVAGVLDTVSKTAEVEFPK
jgi:vacuolar protein sorting-associated protein 13A/C